MPTPPERGHRETKAGPLPYGSRPRTRTKASSHAFLRFDEVRLQRREVRQVGGTRQQLEQARSRSLGIERPRQAQSQDLRQVLIELRRGLEDIGVLRRSRPSCAPPCRRPAPSRCRAVRASCWRDKLQVLGKEFQIDQPTRDVFQVPAILIALLGRDRAAHLDHVASNGARRRARGTAHP